MVELVGANNLPEDWKAQWGHIKLDLEYGLQRNNSKLPAMQCRRIPLRGRHG